MNEKSPDLVERVRDERTMLKHIQMALPGYRGYRKQEDIRQADALVRQGLKAHITKARLIVEDARRAAAIGRDIQILERVASLITTVSAAETEIGHAQQGYSGRRQAVQVGEQELLDLIEYDTNLVNDAAAVVSSAQDLLRVVGQREPDFGTQASTFESVVAKFRGNVAAREKIVLQLPGA